MEGGSTYASIAKAGRALERKVVAMSDGIRRCQKGGLIGAENPFSRKRISH
jgi:hypothetical protein